MTFKQFVLMLLAAIPLAHAQTLDQSWTLTVNGQTVRANPDGSFRITNIAAPDLFGPGGPGTAPDFLSDDFVRLTGYRTQNGGPTQYVFSDPFQITQGETFRVGGLTFTDQPPPQPVSLAVTAPTMVINVGDTLQLTVTGEMADGSTQDLTPRTAWTTYRTSNPDVAQIGANGLITANQLGLAFFTILNEGAIAIKSVSVTSKVLATTVEGFVQLDGAPVSGATVATTLGDSTTTDADGFFSMALDTSSEEGLSLFVTAEVAGEPFRGLADNLEVVPAGLTDAGLIALIPGGDDDGDGIPNDQEEAAGLDPNNPDSDGDGIPDGREDTDLDGLTNGFEVLAGLDINNPDTDENGTPDGEEDPDEDGLTNLEELQAGTNPFSADSDGDGMSDGYELTYGLNPNNLSDVNQDPDNDGLTNLEESDLGTDPFNPDTTPPTAAASTPQSGALDVVINSFVLARFSEAIRGDTLNPTNVRLFPTALTGTDVTGQIALSSDGRSVVFRPQSPLNANTSYSLRIEDLRDLAGNRLVDVLETSFTTGSAQDEARPRLSLTNPASSTQDVPLNAPITMIYDKDMDPASFTSDTFFVRDTVISQPLEGDLFVDEDNRTIRFVPASPYGAGRTILVQANDITDLAGNLIIGVTGISFTTALTETLLEPVLSGISPFDGLNDVPLNAFIMIDFNLPIFLPLPDGAVEITAGGVPLAGEFSFENGNSRLIFTPDSLLDPSTSHTVTVSELLVDVVGTPLRNPDSVTFTTGTAQDNTRPVLVAQSPLSNARDVGRQPIISLRYDEPLNPLTATAGNLQLIPASISRQVPVDIDISDDGTTVFMTPRSPLVAGSLYRYIAIGLSDLVGENATVTNSGFTVGADVDETPPAVLLANPVDGAVGVPLNSRVVLQFDEPLNPNTSDAPIILVENNLTGTPIDGTYSYSSDLTTLTFIPATANPNGELSANTTYALSLEGVTDQSGNPGAFNSTFTTGSTSDDTSPAVISISPSNGQTDVAVTASVVVEFDEDIDPTSVNADSFVVTVTGMQGDVAGSYLVQGSTVSFTPYPEDLLVPPNGARINISINNQITDTAGNTAGFFSSHYFTGGTAETNRPRVLSMSPAPGSTNLGLNQAVTLEISESLDSNTINTAGFNLVTAGGVLLNPTISRSDDNRFITLTRTLPADEAVSVIATEDALDQSGNALVPFAATVFTGPGIDSTQPRVSSMRPTNFSSDVDPNLPVVLFMTKAMDPATLPEHFVVTQNGVIVNGSITLNADGLILQFEPDAPLENNALIQVFLDDAARDTAGNAAIAFNGRFNTAADPTNQGPILRDLSGAFTDAPANTIIEIRYNEPLDPATVSSDTVTLTAPATVSLVGNGHIIRLVPDADLEPVFHTLRIFANAVFDLQGDPVPGLFRSFTPSSDTDTQSPDVTTFSPPANLAGASINARVNVIFNEPIATTSVSADSVIISRNGLIDDNLSFSFGGDNRSMVVAAHSPFPQNSQILVTLDGIRDFAGNPLPLYQSQFETSAELDTQRPVVTDVSPQPNATTVPTNTELWFRLNEAVDPGTLTVDGFFVRDQVLNQDVSGQISLSADARTIRLVPDAPLLSTRRYQMFLASPTADLAGNTVTATATIFTTTAGGDSQGPTVVLTSPAPDTTQAPLNPLIHILFSEPVLGDSLDQVFLFHNNGLGSTPVEITKTLTADDTRLEIRPVSALDLGETYNVVVAGIRDRSGNPMTQTLSQSFTTGRGYDLIRPTVTFADPVNNSLFQPTSTRITVRFSEAIDPITLDGNFRLAPAQVDADIPADIQLSSDRRLVILTPQEPLVPGADYVFSSIGVSDTAGLNQQSSTFIFFTASDEADSQNPTLDAVNPPSSSTTMPLNTRFRFHFNEPVAAAMGGLVSLGTKLGATLNGDLSYSTDRRTVTFTPNAELDANTGYQFNISGFLDQSGNVMVSYGDSTTTTATSDEDRPGVVSISPADDSTDIPVDTPVVITFDETIDPTTINPDNVRIMAAGQQAAGDLTITNDTVTFTPLVTPTLFPAATRVDINVSGVTDLAGNTTFSFTANYDTAGPGETNRPMVTAVTPTDGAVNVPVSPVVSIFFSEPMDDGTLNSNTVNLVRNGETLNLSPVVSDDGTWLFFAPTLAAGETIAVVVTDEALDLNGNPCIPFTSSFSTLPAQGNLGPSVVRQFPINTGVNADPSVSIALLINPPLDPDSLDGAFFVTQDGLIVDGAISLNGDNSILAFTPDEDFQPGALIQITLDDPAIGQTGLPVNSYQGRFTIRDAYDEVTPTILAETGPFTGAPLNVEFETLFSEPIDPATITADTVQLTQGGVPVAATLTTNSGDRVVRLTPDVDLTANTSYTLRLQNITDPDGNTVPLRIRSFTTGTQTDTAAPTVLTASPSDAFTNVPRNAVIHLELSEQLGLASLNSENLSLSGGGATVPLELFDFPSPRILIRSQELLAPATHYTLTVTGLRDNAGNTLTHSQSFTTQSGVDLDRPQTLFIQPGSSETDIPVNTIIRVDFNERMNRTNLDTVDLSDGSSNPVAGTAAFSADGASLTFTPDSVLDPSSNYTFRFQSLEDLAQNTHIGAAFIPFTTAAGADVDPPTLGLTSPPNGLTDVPRNALISVRYSEPIQNGHLDGITLNSAAPVRGVLGNGIDVDIQLTESNTRLNIRPLDLLAPDAVHVLSLTGIRDRAGNLAADSNLSFTTGDDVDLVRASTLYISPAAGNSNLTLDTQVAVLFSERINPITLNADNIILSQNSTPVDMDVQIDPSLQALVVTPSQPLPTDTLITFFLNGHQDLSGRDAPSLSRTFTTGTIAQDTQAPIIDAVTPQDGAVNVPVNAQIKLRFDEPIAADGLIPGNITLSANGQELEAQVSLDSDMTLISIEPAAGLSDNTTYTIDATAQYDWSGNQGAVFSSQFTTNTAQDDAGPSVQSIQPASDAVDVDVNTVVIVTMTESVDATTVNSDTVRLTIDGTSDRVSGSFTVTGAVITFTPDAPLQVATAYELRINSSLKDLAGNGAASFVSHFTTAN